MADTIIKLPAKITLTNTSSTRDVRFVPYRENFTAVVPATKSIELEAQTAGQVLYYLAQQTDDLTVTQEPKDAE